jgi:RNA recognition motif-containing protein
MGTRLYVGNLSFNTMEEDVRSLFSKSGTVLNCDLITDKFTGKSRGFAFVEMSSQADAEKAINDLNGKECDGRVLTVNVARPREDRPRRDFGNNEGRENRRRQF